MISSCSLKVTYTKTQSKQTTSPYFLLYIAKKDMNN